MNYETGEEFLNKLYKDMYMSDVVMHTAEKQDRISKYMERLENVHEIAKSNSHKMDLLKQFYYQKYVIKELPESYINLQKKIYREQGKGELAVTEEEMLKQAQEEQKSSLNYWIEYLTSDDAMYPMWFKYYAFQGMLGLGKFDKEKSVFTKRTKTMVDGFLELNPEILAQIYTVLSHEIGEYDLDQEEIKALEKGDSFKKLYTYYLTKQGFQTNSNETDGIWIKYEQGDNYQELLESIQGKNTGWCTAGKNTCQTQLQNGDFYVYYTKDEEGKYTNPRIAIRMDGKDSIAEVRGVGKFQNLEENMIEIADKKLDEFPDKKEYKKKVHDMRLLTEIDYKNDKAQELSIEEIRFLYEIESKIIGFGYYDPRINEIRQKRNNIADLNTLFFVYKRIDNNLNLDYLKNANGLKLPETINGTLDLRDLASAEGLELPNTINGDLDLRGLTSAEGLKLPETINGELNLRGLTSAEGLKLPNTIDGDLNLRGLTSAEGLKLSETINGTLDLRGLTSVEGLKLPEAINGALNLYSLTSAEGLKLPETINGDLDLRGLTSAEGLKLPETINGDLNLSRLTSVEGLKLPETINGNFYLSGITSAKGLKFPKTINGALNLYSLTSAEGLKLPETINGDLNLSRLTSAEGLKLPETINGDLNLSGLTSAEGLKLPETINGRLDLFCLEDVKQLLLPRNVKHISLNLLPSCKGLVVSKSMVDKIYLGPKCNPEDMEFLSDQDYHNYRKEKLKEMELSKIINDNTSEKIMEHDDSIKGLR